MQVANDNKGRRKEKRLSRTEKAVIYGLIFLVTINAELEFSDRVSLDAFEQSIENAPTAFLWPLSFLFGALGLALLASFVRLSLLKTALIYAAIISFAYGSVHLTALVS